MTIHALAFNKAIALLKGIKAEYTIILDDGAIHQSENFPKPDQKKTRNRRYEHGELLSIYYPFLNGLGVGEMASIPCPEAVQLEHLASAASAWASAHWGNGSHISHKNDIEGKIEVLRMA